MREGRSTQLEPPHPGLFIRLTRVAAASARFAAVLGAVILIGAALVMVASILSRAVTGKQILGDFEIMSLGSALAIFLFLPYCQLTRSHVSISLFTDWLPTRIHRRIDALWSLLLGLCAAFLAWRMSFGMEEALRYDNRTVLLHFPLMVAFAVAILGNVGTAIIAAVDAFRLAGPSDEAEISATERLEL